MIDRDAEVVGHTPPRPRIGAAPAPAADVREWGGRPAVDSWCERMQRERDIIEGERIWRLVREACGEPVADPDFAEVDEEPLF